MPIFTCSKCGWVSLVRSNFKFTTDHKPYCRSSTACIFRVIEKKTDVPEGSEPKSGEALQ